MEAITAAAPAPSQSAPSTPASSAPTPSAPIPSAPASSAPASSAPAQVATSTQSVATSQEPSFDSTLDSMFSEQPGGDQPEGEGQPAPAALPPVEKPAEGDEEASTETEEDPLDDDLSDLPKVPGKGFYVTAAKRDRLFGALRFQQSVEEIVPGATPESLKEMASYNVGARNLLNDLYGGNPDFAVNFLLSHENKNVGLSIAQAVVKRLPEVAPEIHQKLTGEAVQSKVQEFYDTAIRTGDEQLMVLAQHLDMRLNGKYQTKDDFTPAAKPDPEVETLRKRVQQFESTAAQQRDQQVKQFVAETDTVLEQTIEKAIEEALKSVKSLKGKPQWRVMTAELKDAFEKAAQFDSPWKRDYDLRYRQLRQTPTPQARQALVDRVTAMAQQVFRSNRKRVIDEIAGDVVATNQAAHKKHQAAAAKAEPGSGGVPPSTPDAIERIRQAKTVDEGLAAMFGG